MPNEINGPNFFQIAERICVTFTEPSCSARLVLSRANSRIFCRESGSFCPVVAVMKTADSRSRLNAARFGRT